MVGTTSQEILGTSPQSAMIRGFVQTAAKDFSPLLLLGEPGVGKELVARQIHAASARSKEPFLMIDCSLYYERELKREIFGHASLAPGRKARRGILEFATKGTCYIARVEELSGGLQEDLLDFIRTQEFSRLGDGKRVMSGVRLIVSSEKNLQGFVDGGLFHRELHELLSAASLQICPLRQRASDVAVVLAHLAEEFRRAYGLVTAPEFDPQAVEALAAFPWPRNFDELLEEAQQAIERGRTRVGCDSLSFEVYSYWCGLRGDPVVRRVVEELDGYIREFKVLSRLDAEFGDVLLDISGGASFYRRRSAYDLDV